MIIFDTEIKKAILAREEEPIEDIEYCDGWTDYEGMGISVVGVYDYVENRYRVFMDDNINELQELIDSRDLVIGANSIGFDNKLCEANGIKISHKNQYDVMLEIAKLVYPDSKKPYFKGCGLDNCVKANFGTQKSGHGAMAPIDWQRGKVGTVIDYCLNDVRLTKKLVDEIIYNAKLKSPLDGETILTLDNSVLVDELAKINGNKNEQS
jgi:hypothetical protein